MTTIHTTQEPIAPILRKIFPELPEETLREMHEGFARLFGYLHEEYMKEQREKSVRSL